MFLRNWLRPKQSWKWESIGFVFIMCSENHFKWIYNVVYTACTNLSVIIRQHTIWVILTCCSAQQSDNQSVFKKYKFPFLSCCFICKMCWQWSTQWPLTTLHSPSLSSGLCSKPSETLHLHYRSLSTPVCRNRDPAKGFKREKDSDKALHKTATSDNVITNKNFK